MKTPLDYRLRIPGFQRHSIKVGRSVKVGAAYPRARELVEPIGAWLNDLSDLLVSYMCGNMLQVVV